MRATGPHGCANWYLRGPTSASGRRARGRRAAQLVQKLPDGMVVLDAVLRTGHARTNPDGDARWWQGGEQVFICAVVADRDNRAGPARFRGQAMGGHRQRGRRSSPHAAVDAG